MTTSLAEPTTPETVSDAAGTYLTDGQRLFRVIGRFHPTLDRPALLEDCMTLESRTYEARELWDMRLRGLER